MRLTRVVMECCSDSAPHPAQLRHDLCASSQNAIFYYYTFRPKYPTQPDGTVFLTNMPASKTHCFNPVTDSVIDAIDLPKTDKEIPRVGEVACLTASDGMLIAGSLWCGYYAMKSLLSRTDDEHTGDIVNTSQNGDVSDIHTFVERRSGQPQAAPMTATFASWIVLRTIGFLLINGHLQ